MFDNSEDFYDSNYAFANLDLSSFDETDSFINFFNDNQILGYKDIVFNQVINIDESHKIENESIEAFLSNFKMTQNTSEILTDNIKRERENEIQIKENIIQPDSEYNSDNIKKEKINIFRFEKVPHEKIFGRKRKSENKGGKHNKFSEDNIINKIKTKFFTYLLDIINKNVKNESYKIKKLQTAFIANLNKDQNLKIFEKTLAQILLQEKISTKYANYDEYENRRIVKEIYENNKEKKVIKILNLKLKELFGIFRRKLNNNIEITKELQKKISGLDLLVNKNYKDFEYFINNMDEKNTMEKNEFNNYIKNIKNLCLGYENWFAKKIGRIKY